LRQCLGDLGGDRRGVAKVALALRVVLDLGAHDIGLFAGRDSLGDELVCRALAALARK
jgi:hypothetical protein